jgi:hypothetical protein
LRKRRSRYSRLCLGISAAEGASVCMVRSLFAA